MFPSTTSNTFYPTQNPRDKYLAALAMAKQAEEEYLTAEAALESEEHALRRRLKELELEKRRLRGVPSEAAGRLSALGVGPAQPIEQQKIYIRHGAKGTPRLVTRHELERLQARITRPYTRNDAFIQSPPSFPYTFGSDTVLPMGPSVHYPVSQSIHYSQRSPLFGEDATDTSTAEAPALNDAMVQLLRAQARADVSQSIHYPYAFHQTSPPSGEDAPLIQSAPALAPKHRPCDGKVQVKSYGLGQPVTGFAIRRAKAAVSTNTSTAEAPALNDAMAQLLRAQARADVSTNNNGTAEVPAPSAIAESLRAIHAAEVKTSPVAPPSSTPSTSKSAEVVPESKKFETERQQPSHITVEECLGAMLGHVIQRVEASASPGGNTTSGSPRVKTSEVESSLKAELEARLNNDQSNEIKDTIHAIFASLNDAHSNAPSSSSKGKEKAHPISAKVTKDVASSIEAVRNVDAALRTLQSEFVFPVQLDFTPAQSPASSDSESSLTGRLAYTSCNAPVRYYEQSLSGLLAQLDSIESFGHEDLRKFRKSVVEAVESALEELEREVEGRWRSKTAKEAKVAAEQDAVKADASEKIVTSDVAAPAESAKGDELAPVDAPTPVEAVFVGEDEAVAVNATLETSVATPQSEATELLVVSDIVSESSASVTEHPLPASIDPPTSAYPPSSTSIDTIRPYDVESQSSEDPQESFLLSEENSADQETATKKKVDDDTGSDWSEVEA
ncbi:hypothetical protein IW262DRAFT_1332409 [Armillaria fumosa]|nr:hypothetical protein IW262DRAFT_1332409 [Armillaria fumosa]